MTRRQRAVAAVWGLVLEAAFVAELWLMFG